MIGTPENPMPKRDLPKPRGTAYLIGYLEVETLRLIEVGIYSSGAEQLSWAPKGTRPLNLIHAVAYTDDWAKAYGAARENLSLMLAHPAMYWVVEAVLQGKVKHKYGDLTVFEKAQEVHNERFRENGV